MEVISAKKKIIESFILHKNKILLFLKILIAGGLLSYIISFVKINEIVYAFESANYYLIFFAFMLVIPNIFLQYWKWKLTCNSILNYAGKKNIVYSLFRGFAAGAFTPFRVGEYFGRAFLFKEKTLLQVTIATLIDKFFPMVILAFAGAVASILFVYYFYSISVYLAASLFILVCSLFYLLIMLLIDPDFWNNFLFKKIKSIETLYKYLGKMRFLKSLDKNYSLKMFSLSILFYSCFILQFVILVAAFTNEIQFINYFWSAVLVMFAKTFFPAVSLSELGIREGVSVYFLGQMGVAAAPAFNAALFLFFINILFPSLVGLVLLFKKK